MNDLKNFVKKKNYLLCVDSDGCAMDTMNVKHIECFGPCFADEWNVKNRDAVLKRWNEINLYEVTRGINRFKGLAIILKELYPYDSNVVKFAEWTESAKELSESAVSAMAENTGNPVFAKALRWSRAVNDGINSLEDEKKSAFASAGAALAEWHKFFDIAIVSSANYNAVAEEWERCGLLQYTDVITTQSDGSKAHCISELLKKGYSKYNAVMCGDAPGDLDAAESNGIYFYPILVGKENESWAKLSNFLVHVVAHDAGEIGAGLRSQFLSNLGVKG